MYFRNQRLGKASLDKCLKSPVSEQPWTGNVVKGTKHFFDLNDSTFTIFIDQCAGN